MGAKFVNYQIKSNWLSKFEVAEVVRNITKQQAYISPPKNGWITVCDRSLERLSYKEISDFAQRLSTELSCIVLAFVVSSGLHFIDLLYVDGKAVDEFYDDPGGLTFGYKYFNNEVMQRF